MTPKLVLIEWEDAYVDGDPGGRFPDEMIPAYKTRRAILTNVGWLVAKDADITILAGSSQPSTDDRRGELLYRDCFHIPTRNVRKTTIIKS